MLVMSKNVMEWVMEKVVINTTNNHVVICRNKNCNSHKWSISCHIMKQVLQSSATAAQCELLSLRALRKEKNICDLTTVRTAVTPYQEPKGSQDVRNTDTGPRRAEVNSKRMTSVSPDSCILPCIEKS